jgi:hypothetical protein
MNSKRHITDSYDIVQLKVKQLFAPGTVKICFEQTDERTRRAFKPYLNYR